MNQKTTIDWLRFRVQAEPRDVFEALKPLFPQHAPMMNLKPLDRGMLGFQQAANICAEDFVIGRMDYGGESQRGWVRVDIPGTGCAWMQLDDLSSVSQLPKAEIRRLDIAYTTWNGEVTHEQVVKAHESGEFTLRRPPVMTQIISSDKMAGRTCYLGQREKSDKFARCYEKGKEQLAKMPNGKALETWLDGHKVENIYRCEVELKAVNADIPWSAITERDKYFAGAYPFFAKLLHETEGLTLQRRPEIEMQADMVHALDNILTQYGATIFTALHAYQGDMGAVFSKIIGKTHNQALIEAGVLLVEHE